MPFTPDNASLVTEAFERCGIRPSAIGGEHIRSAMLSMDLLMVEWVNNGFREWFYEPLTIDSTTYPLEYTAGSTFFTLPERVTQIFTATWREAGIDTPLYGISHSDYDYIHKKDNEGSKPDRYFLDRSTFAPKLYIWPVLADSAHSIQLTVLTQSPDLGNFGESSIISYQWLEACAAGLAARLALKYAPERLNTLKMEYKDQYEIARRGQQDSSPLRLRRR